MRIEVDWCFDIQKIDIGLSLGWYTRLVDGRSHEIFIGLGFVVISVLW